MARPHNLRNQMSMPPDVEAAYARWQKMHARNPYISYKKAWLDGYREGSKHRGEADGPEEDDRSNG